MRRGRRGHDIFDQPWVPIAAVIGVIAVIAIAAFFFLGSGSSDGQATPGTSTSSSGTSGSSSSGAATGVKSGTIDTSKIKDLPTVNIPSTGTYVKVSYIGGFTGQYGMDGAMVSVTDSGERSYEVVNATGLVSATFKKADSSTKTHELKVEIWKDGKVLKYDSTTAPKGSVTVAQTV